MDFFNMNLDENNDDISYLVIEVFSEKYLPFLNLV